MTTGREQPIVDFDLPSGRRARSAADQAIDTWSRYLSVGGTRAYFIGGSCDTCDFLFSRENAAPLDVGPVAPNPLPLDPSVLDAFGGLLPRGDYLVGDMTIKPRLIVGPSADDYFTNESPALFGHGLDSSVERPPYPYYRADAPLLPSRWIRHEKQFPCWMFQFMCGFEDPARLDREQVELYRAELSAGGPVPTAVSLSVLDVRAPATTQTDIFGWHYCLMHYLLDGHHKVQAAAELGSAIRLIFFLSRDASVADEGEILVVRDALQRDGLLPASL